VRLAQLRDRRGFAGARIAGDDQAAPGADLMPVQDDQPPSGESDLLNGGGGDDGQSAVIAQPRVLVPVAL